MENKDKKLDLVGQHTLGRLKEVKAPESMSRTDPLIDIDEITGKSIQLKFNPFLIYQGAQQNCSEPCNAVIFDIKKKI